MYILQKSPRKQTPPCVLITLWSRKKRVKRLGRMDFARTMADCVHDWVTSKAPGIPRALIWIKTCVKCHRQWKPRKCAICHCSRKNIGRNLGRSSVSMGKITWFAQIFYPNGCILPEFDPLPREKHTQKILRDSRGGFFLPPVIRASFQNFGRFFLPQFTIRRVPCAYTPIYRETGIIRYFWDPTLLSFSLWPKDI